LPSTPVPTITEDRREGVSPSQAGRPQGGLVTCPPDRVPTRGATTFHLSLDKAFVYAPDAEVIHPLRPARWGVSLSQQRKSMFNALLYKKHPVLYRQELQAAPPWHYYGIAGALLAVIGGLLGRKR